MDGSAVETTEPSKALRKAVRTRLKKIHQNFQSLFVFSSVAAGMRVSSAELVDAAAGTGSPVVVGTESLFASSMLESDNGMAVCLCGLVGLFS